MPLPLKQPPFRLDALPLGIVREGAHHHTDLIQHKQSGVVYAVCLDCKKVFDARWPVWMPCVDLRGIRNSPLMAMFQH